VRDTGERRVRHVRADGRRHGSRRPIDLRLQGDPSRTDPMGHQPETGILPNQPVPAPEHVGQSDYTIRGDRQTPNRRSRPFGTARVPFDFALGV